MMTHGTGTVGCNIQAAVEAKHHLIVTHEVTNNGIDRGQLNAMAQKVRLAMGTQTLSVVANRGYFKSVTTNGEDGFSLFLRWVWQWSSYFFPSQ